MGPHGPCAQKCPRINKKVKRAEKSGKAENEKTGLSLDQPARMKPAPSQSSRDPAPSRGVKPPSANVRKEQYRLLKSEKGDRKQGLSSRGRKRAFGPRANVRKEQYQVTKLIGNHRKSLLLFDVTFGLLKTVKKRHFSSKTEITGAR